MNIFASRLRKKVPSFKVTSPITIKVNENSASGYVTIHIDSDSMTKDSTLVSKIEDYLCKQNKHFDMYPEMKAQEMKTFKKNVVHYYIGYVLGFKIGVTYKNATTIELTKKKYDVVTDFRWFEIQPKANDEYQLIFKTGYTLHDRKDPNKNNWPKHDRHPARNKGYDEDEQDDETMDSERDYV